MQFVRREPVFVDTADAKAKELFVIPEHYRESIDSVLIPHGLVVDRANKLAADIREDYGSSVPHLLCVLKVSRAPPLPSCVAAVAVLR